MAKEKYVPLVGITGEGEDYNVYNLTTVERVTGFAIGFVAGFVGSHVMFNSPIVSLIFGLIAGYVAIPIYRNHLQAKRSREILLQFRDLLDSLTSSYSAGENTMGAFEGALKDIGSAHGENAPMFKELKILLKGLHNNFVIEDLLRDMGKRCGAEDIISFAETFAVCNRLGGNLKKVVSESRNIISDKIEIEMEIQTSLTSGKNEINILMVMPFVIIAAMGTMGEKALTANTPTNVAVKIVAIIMFALAYYIGRRITDIKV
ncbi:MAG: kinase [Lachnospiraceae bacterium]|nr:kinase [Lachnospiraceae bacterium]